MLPFHIYDAFTDNPLPIIEAPNAITPAQMQILARQFNLPETIFVQRPRDPAHTARVRIFFPTAEISFAGHPTLGCAIHLALKDAPAGDFTTNIVLEEEAGLVPVTITRRDGRIHGTFTAPVLPERHAAELPVDLIAQALDLSPAAIGLDFVGACCVPYRDSRFRHRRAWPFEPCVNTCIHPVGASVHLDLHFRVIETDFRQAPG